MNAKIYNGNVQPNHKEFKIWVNDEGIIKTWNGTEWIELSGGGSGSGSGDNVKIHYYKLIDEAIDSWLGNDYYAANCKCSCMNTIKYYSPNSVNGSIIAFMFLPCHVNGVFYNSLEEIYANDTEFLKNFIKITEEEYYSIPVINFNVAISNTVYKGEDIQDAQYIIKTYECKMGMTFNEWFDSEYNIDNIRPYMHDGEIKNGKVVAPMLNSHPDYGCTIYGYSGVGIEFKYSIADYFYDRTVNTPNGRETCQLIIH